MRGYWVLILMIGFGCSNNSGKTEINDGEEKKELRKLVRLFKNIETEGRGEILYEINELEYPEIKELLEKSLSDRDEHVRIVAIQLILENRQIESLDKLIKMFEETNNHTIVSNLCRTFGDFKSREPIPGIIGKLESENLMIVYDCALVLGEIGGESEIPILEELRKNEGMPQIFDETGFLIQYTEFSIGEMAEKSIRKINAKLEL